MTDMQKRAIIYIGFPVSMILLAILQDYVFMFACLLIATFPWNIIILVVVLVVMARIAASE
jgi:hypothetical protein